MIRYNIFKLNVLTATSEWLCPSGYVQMSNMTTSGSNPRQKSVFQYRILVRIVKNSSSCFYFIFLCLLLVARKYNNFTRHVIRCTSINCS